MASWKWLAGSLVVLLGSACTSVRPTPDVSDVYFTNAESGPNYQLRRAGSTPYQVRPPATEFDRQRDAKITIVVVFSTGREHSLQAVLNAPDGAAPRPLTWSAPSRTQFGTWVTSSAWWAVGPSMAPGRYTVDLTIDRAPAGTYAFDLK